MAETLFSYQISKSGMGTDGKFVCSLSKLLRICFGCTFFKIPTLIFNNYSQPENAPMCFGFGPFHRSPPHCEVSEIHSCTNIVWASPDDTAHDDRKAPDATLIVCCDITGTVSLFRLSGVWSGPGVDDAPAACFGLNMML